MTDADCDTDNPRVLFSPLGFTREPRWGRIFEQAWDSAYGATYYVRDESGEKYQLGPSAILGGDRP